MPGKTVNSAIVLLVIGNALALISDVVIKLLGEDVPVLQFVFLRCLCTVLMLLPFYKMIDRQALFAGLGYHALRAHIGIVGIAAMVMALATLPLATANAVFYAAPLIVVVLSVVIFREQLTLLSVIAVISGFLGILVILRPVEFGWGALGALITAFSLAFNALLVRKLPRHQTMVHSVALNYLLCLPVAGVLALIEGREWSWSLMASAGASSFFILGYNFAVLLAYRHVAANQVTSAEYTGLIWAVLIGWVGFSEVPDLWFLAGSMMIVAPLVALGLRSRQAAAGRSIARKNASLPADTGEEIHCELR
ncbi:DMT family transporter [Allohahella marinimesophila]|uniref:DMT family transporter n=1 Tax=Allohahella marinimesophila TaxID=1054972 RepID=A0ABP7PRY1_9GAMM